MTAASPATSAAEFVDELAALASPDEVERVSRFFHGGRDGADENQILGVPIGEVFPVAKRHVQMWLADIEMLLDSPFYEVRMGAVSIMDFQARAKSTTPAQRKALFDLYLRRHDCIDNWDLVDRAAPHVIGGYLLEKPRDVLYRLARSENPWERRTAIVSTYAFIRRNEVDDTFQIAELLVADPNEYVQKATGSWLREAGKRAEDRLIQVLEQHAAAMPRVTLRYATEKLAPDVRTRLRNMKSAG